MHSSSAEPLLALFSRHSRTVHPSMCSRHMQDEVVVVALRFDFAKSPSPLVSILSSLLPLADICALEPDIRVPVLVLVTVPASFVGTANSTPSTAGQRTPALRQRVKQRASAFVRLLVRRTSRVGWRYDLANRSLQMAARDVDDDDVPLPLLLVLLTIVR